MTVSEVSPFMQQNLEAITGMPNYRNWIYSLVEPYIGASILEAGCGNGNLTEFLIRSPKVQRYVGVDHDPVLKEQLQAAVREAGAPGRSFHCLDLESPLMRELGANSFDLIVCLNVLEHIKDDVEVLKTFGYLLKPGGRVALLVPAHRWMYGSIDVVVGHHRRYTKSELAQKSAAAGLSVEQLRHFNLLGIPAWIWHGKILKLRIHHKQEMRAWDKLVPLLRRFEKVVPIPLGLSYFLVLHKQA